MLLKPILDTATCYIFSDSSTKNKNAVIQVTIFLFYSPGTAPLQTLTIPSSSNSEKDNWKNFQEH